MPTDAVIPEGGYESVSANLYTKTGPGPFAVGINKVAREGFLRLARQIEG